MEQSKKNLKFMSIAMVILVFLSLARIIAELIFTDFSGTEFSKETILITTIVSVVISIILLVPQFYIGVKGIKIAKNPDSSKAHIIWCRILIVICAIGFVALIIEAVSKGEFMGDIPLILDILVDIILYTEYNRYAKQVRVNA